MAIVRRAGFGSIFEVENETVGIGTTGTATNTVQVLGETKASGALIAGISTLTTYQGFIDNNPEFGNSNVDINSQSGTMGNIEICHGDFNVSSASTLTSSVNQLTLTNSFSVPTGDTDSRIHCHTIGSMRFNEELGTLEFYTGDEWKAVNSYRDAGSRGRAVIAGGYQIMSPAGSIADIETLQISTFGNSTSFGDITSGATNALSAMSSSTRMLMVKGDGTTIEYVTIASEGNPIDFGDTHTLVYRTGGEGASSTRGLILGGRGAPGSGIVNIQYVEMATLGNMLDFGDLNTNGRGQSSGGASPTRAFATSFTTYGSKVEMVTIASTGNAVNFGNLTFNGGYNGGCSNNTTLIIGGGYSGADTNSIRGDICKFDMTSGGQAVAFGEFETQRGYAGTTSNSVRGVYCGGFIGNPGSGNTNITTIDTVQFASDGGAIYFGDLGQKGYDQATSSDSHGGLGGF